MELDNVSVRDHQAFAERHLSDMNQEVEDFKVFTWNLVDYRRQSKRLVSPEFECGGHKWNILLFPMGNSTGQANDMVSVYLNYGDPKHAKEGWHVCAQFALAISNPNDPTVFIQSQAHHRFNNEEQDWGFTRFVELRKLFTPADGRPRPVIENDETEITAFVRVLKDPTGVLWHNFHNYDSKKETGYVGLKNQGATCYMNSLLQSLFLTSYYRKAVYQIPTDGDTLDSVPLALQRVFYLLQTSDQPVSTTELTKSFGWKGFDSFLQHDVQEFNRVLQDKLEGKMKGTSADGAIKTLFAGKMRSYIKCINVDYESSRSEDFYDIQLNVKGMRNVEESFRNYIAEEIMEGENKYHAEGFGLQDAKMGVIFQTLPPVLHLQLKRFEYDMMRDVNVKINDRYEFPFEIDLAPYLDKDVDTSESYVYNLHGVLVHSGDVHGGHYFTLIKPNPEARWLRFDDDRVVHVTDREVLEDNFGGEILNGLDHNGARIPPAKNATKRFTNAYMLVYVRATMARQILATVTEQDTPTHLRTRLETERKEADAKRREREEQHLYLTAKIITNETFGEHSNFDLATFEDRAVPPTDLPTFRVLKTRPFVEFKEQVLKELEVPPGDVRLWVLVNRQNKTVRPDAPVPENDPTYTVDAVRDRMASRQYDLKLYLEHSPPGELKKWHDMYPGETPIMIFVKHFDYEQQTLKGVGHFYVHRQLRVADLVTMINQRMGYSPDTALKVYEEIKPTMIELMKPKATFLQSEIQDGDIVCYQIDRVHAPEGPTDKPRLYANPIQFYDYFQHRVLLHFRPRLDSVAEAKAPEFDLVLSKTASYEAMTQQVGAHLNHDPAKLRFTSANQQGLPKAIIRRQQHATVADFVLPNMQQNAGQNLLFYELLDISLVELETKKNIKITWMGAHNKEESTHVFLMPKTSSILDMTEQLKTLAKISDEVKKIRIFEVLGGRKQKVFASGEIIREIHDGTELYAEEVPQDEREARDGEDKVVTVFHFAKEPSRTHGVPFRFVLRPHEKFGDTKKRLQVRMGTNEKEFARMKFSLIQPSTYTKPSYVADEDVLRDHKWQDDDFLGVDHIDRTTKRVGERAVVIR
ncbi:uncharacterized protein L969DRAFT_86115 [Mixia osmundae IAM 14324]|nr:uncharacterized protein L969DRAFT_86115 [Mixia osmundae IAM 14324]KEI40875.1 hypothetical protein L969DRAFT_86115 [Mixia osmundae IAM 14324]